MEYFLVSVLRSGFELSLAFPSLSGLIDSLDYPFVSLSGNFFRNHVFPPEPTLAIVLGTFLFDVGQKSLPMSTAVFLQIFFLSPSPHPRCDRSLLFFPPYFSFSTFLLHPPIIFFPPHRDVITLSFQPPLIYRGFSPPPSPTWRLMGRCWCFPFFHVSSSQRLLISRCRESLDPRPLFTRAPSFDELVIIVCLPSFPSDSLATPSSLSLQWRLPRLRFFSPFNAD